MEDEATTLTRYAAVAALFGGVVLIALAFVLSQPTEVKVLAILAGIGVFGVPCVLLLANKELPKDLAPIMHSFCWVLALGTLVLSGLLVAANYYWADIPPTIEASTNQLSNSRLGRFEVVEPQDPQDALNQWLSSEENKGHAVRVVGTIRKDEAQPGKSELLVRIFPASSYLVLYPGPVADLRTFLIAWLAFLYVWLCVLVALLWANNILKVFRATPADGRTGGLGA
jgi:hypothetical protein